MKDSLVIQVPSKEDMDFYTNHICIYDAVV